MYHHLCRAWLLCNVSVIDLLKRRVVPVSLTHYVTYFKANEDSVLTCITASVCFVCMTKCIEHSISIPHG